MRGFILLYKLRMAVGDCVHCIGQFVRFYAVCALSE